MRKQSQYGLSATLRTIGLLILLIFFQLLVLDNICLYGLATPLLAPYILVCLWTLLTQNRVTMPTRILALVLGFALGVFFDSFTNSVGVSTCSLTLIGLLIPILRQLKPTLHHAIFTVVYCFAYFPLDTFAGGSTDAPFLLFALCSAALSYLFVLVLIFLRGK